MWASFQLKLERFERLLPTFENTFADTLCFSVFTRIVLPIRCH